MINIIGSPSADLVEYVRLITSQGLSNWIQPIGASQAFGPALCGVVDRRENFQAELCVFPPNAEIPEHTHPNVEGVECFIAGSIKLRMGEKGGEFDRLGPLSFHIVERLMRGNGFHVPAGAIHGASVGPSGAMFLSVQRWIGEPPSHVGHNWVGVTYSEDQAQRLANGV